MNRPSLSAPIDSLTTLSVFEVHDGDHPFLHSPARRGPAHVSSRVGAAERGTQDDRVAGHDQILDIQVEIGKRLVVAADRLDSGRGPCPERIDVLLA